MATNLKFYKKASAPTSATQGSIWFDTSEGSLKLLTGGSWIPFGITKEAFLNWGGKNFANSFSPIDAAMIPELGANRFAFLKPEGITYEYSEDGGNTWLEYNIGSLNKSGIFSIARYSSFFLGGSQHYNETTRNQYALRITIDTHLGKIYTILNKFCIYFSTNGMSNTTCTIRAKTRTNYLAGNDIWTTYANEVRVAGWGGWNIINTSEIDLSQFDSHTTKKQILQFIFKQGDPTSSANVQYANASVQGLFAFGGVGWVTPSNMAENGHLYAFDSFQNATFPAAITSTNGFKLVNSSNDYVLLGGGSSKKITDLSVSSAKTATSATFASGLTWAEYKD